MLGWALTFLILALVAGYMGFFGLAGLAATIAKLLLIVFVILLIVSAFSGALRGRPPDLEAKGGCTCAFPARILEHPIEAAIASLLLLALLFGSADLTCRREAAGNRRPSARRKNSEKNSSGPERNFRAARYLPRADVRSGTPPAPSTARLGCPLSSPKIRENFSVKAFCPESGLFGVSSRDRSRRWRVPRRGAARAKSGELHDDAEIFRTIGALVAAAAPRHRAAEPRRQHRPDGRIGIALGLIHLRSP